MFAHVKFESALVGLVCIAVGCMNGKASAVTADVARKCAALTAKAYRPQVPGNPAAGLAKGTVQFKRDYFNKCVANGGNMDDDAPERPTLPPSHGAASVPQRDRTSELSQSLCPLIQSVATQNELPVEFFARLIWQESRLRPDAVGPVTRSGKRAQGIAQFMPATAAERFLLDAFDPAQALPKSAEFLRELRAKFGNLGFAAAAYNAGPQRVQDWLSGKRTLPSETLAYVRSVTGHSAEEWKRPDARTWQVSIASDTPCVGTTKLAAKPAPAAPSAPQRGRHRRAVGQDQVGRHGEQLRRVVAQYIFSAAGPAVLDPNVASLDPSQVLQAVFRTRPRAIVPLGRWRQDPSARRSAASVRPAAPAPQAATQPPRLRAA